MYKVIRCSRCGRYTYARKDRQTRRCPCGKTIDLRKAKVYARVEDERYAGEVVRRLQEAGHGSPVFKTYG